MSSQTLLPPNASKFERSLESAAADSLDLKVPVRDLWSPWNCPPAVIAWLGWSLSVDNWDADWTIEQKRRAVADSVEVHRRKGTVGAVKRALAVLGHEVEVDEDTGQVYTFAVRLRTSIEQGMEAATLDKAERLALGAKNVRSHLASVGSATDIPHPARVASASLSGEITKVWPEIVDEVLPLPSLYYLTAEQSVETTDCWPYTAIYDQDEVAAAYAVAATAGFTPVLSAAYTATVASIRIECTESCDDDIRVRINGQTVSDTRWNVGWYHGTEYLGPGGNPNWSTEGFRVVELEPTPETEHLFVSGALVQIDTFNGWFSMNGSPWTAVVTWSDGITREFTGGSTIAQPAPVSEPNPLPPDYFSTGPHFDHYAENGSFIIAL